jgi:hypothetical protein
VGISDTWFEVCYSWRIPFDELYIKGKVVPVLNLIKHYAMKAYGGVDV